MRITDRVKNAVTAFSGEQKTTNSMSATGAHDFLKYGNRRPMLQDWSQVEMSDQDMYSGYSYAAIKKRANRAAVVAKRFLYTEASPVLMDAAKVKDEEVIHPYLKAIEESKEFTLKKFWHDISTYLDLEGVYYLMAVRAIGDPKQDGTPNVGAVQKFVMMNPYQVRRIIKDSDGTIGGYVETKDGMYREIPKEMIIEIRQLNPFDNDKPFSMTDAAKESQFTMKQAGDYTRNSIKGNINAPGSITTDVVLEDHIFDNFVSRIQNHSKGEPIYGNGAGAINWQSMQVDMDKAALDKINEIHRSVLFAVSGTSKTTMGIEESGTGREVSKTQKDDFTENAIMPQIEDIIDALNLDYRKYYPEWDSDKYEILLDNPLESDRDAEKKDIEIRESEFDMTQKLVSMGYEYDVAARFAKGDIGIEELGEPTLEPAMSDQEADDLARSEMGLLPAETQGEEPESGDTVDDKAAPAVKKPTVLPPATTHPSVNEAVKNSVNPRVQVWVTADENEKRVKAARKRLKEQLKADKEQKKAAKEAEKQAKAEAKEAKKLGQETPPTPIVPVEEPSAPVLQQVNKVDDPVTANQVQKAMNQIASRDFPDLYDGIDIDTDKLGCIMMDVEKIPVAQYIKDFTEDDLYFETNYDQSPLVGEEGAHVTLLFGLLENGNVWKDKVNQLLVNWSLDKVTIQEVSYFDLGDSYAVIGLVEPTPALVDGHERLTLLPHINTFSEYHPHVTLAYIKHDEELLDKWVKPLNKKYKGQKVATKGINYGDLPEPEDVEEEAVEKESEAPAYRLTDSVDDNAEGDCLCCNGVGEHDTGYECYRCDASGLEEDAVGPIPCGGRSDSDELWMDEDGVWRHEEERNTTTLEDEHRPAVNKDFYDELPGFVCIMLDEIQQKYGYSDWFLGAWNEYREHVLHSDIDTMMMPNFIFGRYIDDPAYNKVEELVKNASTSHTQPAQPHTDHNHENIPSANYEAVKNALSDQELSRATQSEAALQQAVSNLERDVAQQIILRYRQGRIKDAQNLLTQAQEKEFKKNLTLALAGFYTILYPMYAGQQINQRAGQFGQQGAFGMTPEVKKYIDEAAKKAGNSHIDTILKDFTSALQDAEDASTETSLIDLVTEEAAKQNEGILSKLPKNANREDIVKAVKKGVFDNENIYKRARELARQGKGLDAITRSLAKEYQNVSRVRAKTIARHETNRVFNMAQYQADVQFLQEAGLTANAYKRLYNRANDPCPVCAQLIEESNRNPIPFAKNFADLGDTLTATYKKPNGKLAVQKVPVNYEAITAGNIHVNCRCEYELLIQNSDGTFLNEVNSKTVGDIAYQGGSEDKNPKASNAGGGNPNHDPATGEFTTGAIAATSVEALNTAAAANKKLARATSGKAVNTQVEKIREATSAYIEAHGGDPAKFKKLDENWVGNDYKSFEADVVSGKNKELELVRKLQQAYFQEQGITEITLYRGVYNKQASDIKAALKAGKKVKISGDSASSYTGYEAVAQDYADGAAFTAPDKITDSVVIKQTFKVKDIVYSTQVSPFYAGNGDDEFIVSTPKGFTVDASNIEVIK